jgi:hypothetical protein
MSNGLHTCIIGGDKSGSPCLGREGRRSGRREFKLQMQNEIEKKLIVDTDILRELSYLYGKIPFILEPLRFPYDLFV